LSSRQAIGALGRELRQAYPREAAHRFDPYIRGCDTMRRGPPPRDAAHRDMDDIRQDACASDQIVLLEDETRAPPKVAQPCSARGSDI
jgi:hypothetical protein